MNATAGYFTIGLDLGDGELDGDIVSLNAGLGWKPIDHLGLGLMYQYYDVDVEVQGTRLNGVVDYRYDGPASYIGTQF